MVALQTIPPPGTNNVWFHNPDSRCVLVFVHGIHSDSRSSWLLENKRTRKQVYWPKLIAEDNRLSDFGIFLGGYSTQFASHDYGLDDCARELYDRLFTPQDPAKEAILKGADTIIFLCHSTGGIVVRHMLVRHVVEFREKKIGIILMASPSRGSFWADILAIIIKTYKSRLAKVLQSSSELLLQLDNDFSSLVTDKQNYIPNLTGAEACEHYFILRRTIFGRLASKIPFFLPRIVDRDSAGAYWRPVKMIADTDHFSIVKPESTSHEVHNFLRVCWQRFQAEFPHSTSKPDIPMALPARPLERWIGPTTFVNTLREALSKSQDVAVVGNAGSGKTLLVLGLLWDSDFIRQLFPDGILWGPPSPSMDFNATIIEWAASLGLRRDAMIGLQTLQQRALVLSNQIGEKRLLLVLDNCASLSDATSFKFIGNRVTRLITTRSGEVAQSFAPEATLTAPALDLASIRELLSSGGSDFLRSSPTRLNIFSP